MITDINSVFVGGTDGTGERNSSCIQSGRNWLLRFSVCGSRQRRRKRRNRGSLFPCTKDGSRLLPRPISICEADPEEGGLRCIQNRGAGTRNFLHLGRGLHRYHGPSRKRFSTGGENVPQIGGESGSADAGACKNLIVRSR